MGIKNRCLDGVFLLNHFNMKMSWWLIVCLAEGAVNRISHSTLLLPVSDNLSESVTFRLQATSCMVWRSSRDDLLEISFPGVCSEWADVRPLLKSEGKAIVFADEGEHNSPLRCEVYISHISEISMVTRVRRIGVGEVETLAVEGSDVFGNIFSSLEGLKFTWKVHGQALRSLPLSLSQYAVSSKRREIEETGAQSDQLVVIGDTVGVVNVGVERKGRKIHSASVQLVVSEGFYVKIAGSKASAVVALAPCAEGLLLEIYTLKGQRIPLPSNNFRLDSSDASRLIIGQGGEVTVIGTGDEKNMEFSSDPVTLTITDTRISDNIESVKIIISEPENVEISSFSLFPVVNNLFTAEGVLTGADGLQLRTLGSGTWKWQVEDDNAADQNSVLFQHKFNEAVPKKLHLTLSGISNSKCNWVRHLKTASTVTAVDPLKVSLQEVRALANERISFYVGGGSSEYQLKGKCAFEQRSKSRNEYSVICGKSEILEISDVSNSRNRAELKINVLDFKEISGITFDQNLTISEKKKFPIRVTPLTHCSLLGANSGSFVHVTDGIDNVEVSLLPPISEEPDVCGFISVVPKKPGHFSFKITLCDKICTSSDFSGEVISKVSVMGGNRIVGVGAEQNLEISGGSENLTEKLIVINGPLKLREMGRRNFQVFCENVGIGSVGIIGPHASDVTVEIECVLTARLVIVSDISEDFSPLAQEEPIYRSCAADRNITLHLVPLDEFNREISSVKGQVDWSSTTGWSASGDLEISTNLGGVCGSEVSVTARIGGLVVVRRIAFREGLVLSVTGNLRLLCSEDHRGVLYAVGISRGSGDYDVRAEGFDEKPGNLFSIVAVSHLPHSSTVLGSAKGAKAFLIFRASETFCGKRVKIVVSDKRVGSVGEEISMFFGKLERISVTVESAESGISAITVSNEVVVLQGARYIAKVEAFSEGSVVSRIALNVLKLAIEDDGNSSDLGLIEFEAKSCAKCKSLKISHSSAFGDKLLTLPLVVLQRPTLNFQQIVLFPHAKQWVGIESEKFHVRIESSDPSLLEIEHLPNEISGGYLVSKKTGITSIAIYCSYEGKLIYNFQVNVVVALPVTAKIIKSGFSHKSPSATFLDNVLGVTGSSVSVAFLPELYTASGLIYNPATQYLSLSGICDFQWRWSGVESKSGSSQGPVLRLEDFSHKNDLTISFSLNCKGHMNPIVSTLSMKASRNPLVFGLAANSIVSLPEDILGGEGLIEKISGNLWSVIGQIGETSILSIPQRGSFSISVKKIHSALLDWELPQRTKLGLGETMKGRIRLFSDDGIELKFPGSMRLEVQSDGSAPRVEIVLMDEGDIFMRGIREGCESLEILLHGPESKHLIDLRKMCVSWELPDSLRDPQFVLHAGVLEISSLPSYLDIRKFTAIPQSNFFFEETLITVLGSGVIGYENVPGLKISIDAVGSSSGLTGSGGVEGIVVENIRLSNVPEREWLIPVKVKIGQDARRVVGVRYKCELSSTYFQVIEGFSGEGCRIRSIYPGPFLSNLKSPVLKVSAFSVHPPLLLVAPISVNLDFAVFPTISLIDGQTALRESLPIRSGITNFQVHGEKCEVSLLESTGKFVSRNGGLEVKSTLIGFSITWNFERINDLFGYAVLFDCADGSLNFRLHADVSHKFDHIIYVEEENSGYNYKYLIAIGIVAISVILWLQRIRLNLMFAELTDSFKNEKNIKKVGFFDRTPLHLASRMRSESVVSAISPGNFNSPAASSAAHQLANSGLFGEGKTRWASFAEIGLKSVQKPTKEISRSKYGFSDNSLDLSAIADNSLVLDGPAFSPEHHRR